MPEPSERPRPQPQKRPVKTPSPAPGKSPPSSRLSPLSILSAIFAGASPLFYFLCYTSIPVAGAAIVLGHLARFTIRKSDGKEHGNELALGGLILGYGTLAFTVVRIVVALFLVTSPSPPEVIADTPKARLERAQSQVLTDSKGNALGNTPQARILAERFATLMEETHKDAFTRTRGKFKLSGGHYVTWCELHEGKCAFIVHVPEYRRFTDDASETLDSLAWYAARRTVADTLAPGDQLAVGLRGVLNYGSILVGSNSGDEPTEGLKESSEDATQLYAFFERPLRDDPVDYSRNGTVPLPRRETANSSNPPSAFRDARRDDFSGRPPAEPFRASPPPWDSPANVAEIPPREIPPRAPFEAPPATNPPTTLPPATAAPGTPGGVGFNPPEITSRMSDGIIPPAMPQRRRPGDRRRTTMPETPNLPFTPDRLPSGMPAVPPRFQFPGDPQSAEEAAGLLASEDGLARSRAMSYLRSHTSDAPNAEVAAKLVSALRQADEGEAFSIVMALEPWITEDQVARLEPILNSQNILIRNQLYRVIGKTQTVEAARILAKHLDDQQSRIFVTPVIKSMGKTAEPALLPLLNTKDPELCVEICRILQEVGTKKSAVRLQKLSNDRNPVVANAARTALGAVRKR